MKWEWKLGPREAQRDLKQNMQPWGRKDVLWARKPTPTGALDGDVQGLDGENLPVKSFARWGPTRYAFLVKDAMHRNDPQGVLRNTGENKEKYLALETWWSDASHAGDTGENKRGKR